LVGAYSDDTVVDGAGAAYLFDGSTGALLQTFLNPTPEFAHHSDGRLEAWVTMCSLEPRMMM